MGHGDAQRIIDVIRKATAQGMHSGAQIEYQYGEIAEVVEGDVFVEASAYLNSNYEAASEGFRVPALMHVSAGDYGFFAVDHGTGGKWVVEILPNSLYAKLSIDVNTGMLYVGDGDSEGTPIVPGEGGGSGSRAFAYFVS